MMRLDGQKPHATLSRARARISLCNAYQPSWGETLVKLTA